MATSTVTLYRINWPKDTSPLIDNFATFLTNMHPYVHYNQQYVIHDLDITHVIQLTQASVDSLNYNYCGIRNSDEDITFYYHILKPEWASPQALRLHLHMDTVNTLANANTYCDPRNFLPTTEIERQHMDRFINDGSYAYPLPLKRKIDREQEDFAPGSWDKTSDTILEDQTDNDDWYIMYSTDNTQASEFEGVPVKTSVFASSNKTIYTISSGGGAVLKESSFGVGSGTYSFSGNNAFLYVTSPNAIVNYNNFVISPGMRVIVDRTGALGLFTHETTVSWITFTGNVVAADVKRQHCIYVQLASGTQGVNAIPLTTDCSMSTDPETGERTLHMPFSSRGKRYKMSDEIPVRIFAERGTSSISIYHSLLDQLRKSDIESLAHYDAANTYSSYAVKSIDEIDKTDDRILGISKVPYCPLPLTYDRSASQYVLMDDSYAYVDSTEPADGHTIRYVGTGLPSLSREGIIDIPMKDYLIHSIGSGTPSYASPVRKEVESKLYGSQFKTLKLNYDNFNKEIMNERFSLPEGYQFNPSLSIDYKVSNGMSSEFGFRVNSANAGEYLDNEDYGQYLIVSRQNGIGLLSSNYLNYMRNSYNYNLKQQSMELRNTIASSAVKVGGSIVSGAVSGAMLGSAAGGVGAIPGAAVGLALGVTQSIIGISRKERMQRESENQKIFELQKEGASVSGSSDVDMLSWYNGNRLHLIEYNPTEAFQNKAFNLFRLYGYAHPLMEKPDVDSRIWYNYIKCNPQIDYEGTKVLKSAWIDDLKEKYNNGVTVFHTHNGTYCLDRQYENWEKWILGE